VPAGDDRVYGLKGVTNLVRQFMTRKETGGSLRSVDCPVLVVEGFRGTGKSAVLRKLDSMLDHVPHARLDLDTNRHASVPEILSAIAFDLSRKYPKYELRFPRFIVGQLAVRQELDLTDHSLARRQLEEALRHYRNFDAIREVLVETAGPVLDGVLGQAGVPIKSSPRLLRGTVNWLSERAPGRAISLGPFQNWFGHRDLGLHSDSIDVLVDLNSWARHPDDQDNRRRVDELLLSAFLADLRTEFGRGRQADARSLNGVVLLDNADTELGRRFLGQLVTARRQRAVGDQDDPDPLTVVVTSRGGLLADVPEADRASVAPEELHASREFDVDELSRYWWLGLRLPDLTRDEVGRAAADMGLVWGNSQRMTRIVYDLTGGHPAATSLVLGAAQGVAEKWVKPEEILARPDRSDELDGGSATVEEAILDRLLTDVSDATRRDLVTCAPARQHAHALALAGMDGVLVSGRAGYETVDTLLWPAEGSAGLSLLRRLLTRRLAARSDSGMPGWSDVIAKLRHICREGGDDVGDLYYALADDELGFVATRLRQRLDELDSTAWYELVTAIAEAPHRSRPGEAPIDEVRTTVAATELEPSVTCVARLVAALRIVADPCTDSRRRDLHLQIADDFGEVARLCPGGPHPVFLEAARRHRREAEWWD
jgi:hypothetical protein